jgi:ribosomal protein L40E
MSAGIGSVPQGGVVPTPQKKSCNTCGLDIPLSAVWCKECRAPQKAETCRICGAVIPEHAKVCNTCKSYQDWRHRIPGDQVALALIVAILSLLGTLLPQVIKFANLRSRTAGFFLSTEIDEPASKSKERSVMTVRLTNQGGRPSQVESARIDFGTSGLAAIEDFPVLNRGSMTVPAEDKSDLKLFVHEFKSPPVTKAEIEKLASALCSAKTVVHIKVRERSRLFGTLEPERDIEPVKLPTNAARDWILERVTITGSGFVKEDCP